MCDCYLLFMKIVYFFTHACAYAIKYNNVISRIHVQFIEINIYYTAIRKIRIVRIKL